MSLRVARELFSSDTSRFYCTRGASAYKRELRTLLGVGGAR